MRTAHTEKERDEAQRLFDEAESLIDGSTLDDFDFLVTFSADRYQLERGEGWIGSPEKNLRDPAKALSCLPVLCQADAVPEEDFQIVGHRQAENHLLQAEIAIEQGDYSEAATLALEALNYMEHLQSMVHLKKLVRIYRILKQGPDCHNENVRVLEVRIARHLYPERFGKDDEG